jgi:hypothetical protein
MLELEGKPANIRERELGLPWLTAIAELPEQVVVESKRFATQWDRRHGEVVIVGAEQNGDNLTFTGHGTVEEVEAALTAHGFHRAEDWTQLDETGQIWRTELYSSPQP